MLIKITESCSMGCSHCMNDAKPCDRHMSTETVDRMMDFLINNDIYTDLIISGGEPTEHPQFTDIIKTIINRLKTDSKSCDALKLVTITTNGLWCETHYDETKQILDMNSDKIVIAFQVSNDSRYYPKRIDLNNPVYKLFGMIMCIDNDCVQQIYPQGRARNFTSWQSNCSKCFNIRSITKQLFMKQAFNLINREVHIKDVINVMEDAKKYCTPAIHYNGKIGLGESDLCPTLSHDITDSSAEILNDILKFECHGCDFINKSLPPLHQSLLTPIDYNCLNKITQKECD